MRPQSRPPHLRTSPRLALSLAVLLAAPFLARGQAPATARPRMIDLPATNAWVAVELPVEKGKCYTLTARGTWRGSEGAQSGPEGICPPAAFSALGTPPALNEQDQKRFYLNAQPRNALIARFNADPFTFVVGKSATFIAPVTGKLSLRINDTDAPSQNRSGRIQVAMADAPLPALPADGGELTITAQIDAMDLFHITPDGLFWEYGGEWTRAGHSQGQFPTVVNGAFWWPDWGDKRSNALPIKGAWPSDAPTITVVSSEGSRGKVTPERAAPLDVVFRFQDNGGGHSFITARFALKPGPATAAKPVAATPVGSIEVQVPSARRPARPVRVTSPENPDAIERPQFLRTPKPLLKNITSATALMVRTSPDGTQTGSTGDIIANVSAQSRDGTRAGAGFFRADGDPMMKTAFEEAVRAVTMRYPLWEPGHIDFSFGEKFTRHGGPSAGTVFALLMLSTLEGFEIDPKTAFTGDITVDWKVRPVGGVAAKLRGALNDGCLHAAIPAENEHSFPDTALLYGPASYWNLQVFSISTLQQAVALGRTDRDAKLAEAMKLFADLQPALNKSQRPTLQDPATRATLKRVLELAPNHLSAKYTLAFAEGTAPKNLSPGQSDLQLLLVWLPYIEGLKNMDKLDRTTVTRLTFAARKRIDVLRPIIDKKYAPLLVETAAFLETLDAYTAGRTTQAALRARWTSLEAKAKLSEDPTEIDKRIRDTR